MTTVLLQLFDKMYMKYDFHNKFRMIFHDQNTFIKFQKQSFADVFQNMYF